MLSLHRYLVAGALSCAAACSSSAATLPPAGGDNGSPDGSATGQNGQNGGTGQNNGGNNSGDTAGTNGDGAVAPSGPDVYQFAGGCYAIRGVGGEPMSGFKYSGPFTETVLLGNLAVRLGKKIEWDGPRLKATNAPEADSLIRREYRKGWEV